MSPVCGATVSVGCRRFVRTEFGSVRTVHAANMGEAKRPVAMPNLHVHPNHIV